MKPRYKSKTHWFNAIMATLVVAETNSALLQPVLGPDAFAYLSFAMAVGNIFLREITKEPVG